MPALSVQRERLRSRLWPIPAVAALCAGVLAVLLSRVRPGTDSGQVWWPGEPSSARGLLEVLAGSSLTVVALVFSLQVVALQLAATQYSPRLLRTHARDGWIQGSLAVLPSTFVFALVTLALFGTVDRPPRVSVTVAVLLGLASVAALVGVVAHIVVSLRVETMLAEIHADAEVVVRATLEHDIGPAPTQWPPPHRAGDGSAAVRSRHSGFVQAVDRDRIIAWAEENDGLVRLDVAPGDHVLTDQPVGRVWAATSDTDAVVESILVGFERTPDEDPGFGLVQLTDIAMRALSPSLNDPTTAVHTIGHLASLLGLVAQRDAGAVRRVQGEHEVRLLERVTSREDTIAGVCRPIVRAGASHPEVLLAVADMLTYLRTRAPDLAPALADEGHYVARAGERSLPDPDDRAMVVARLRGVASPRR
jgi:uncharacterized membrane protein